jgi:hypothetical protein
LRRLSRTDTREFAVLDRVISGGQSGADQAGLRTARIPGIPTGGTAPRGWLAEVAYVLLDGSARWVTRPRSWLTDFDLDEQAKLPDVDTADFTVARALLRKGRSYEEAVKTFEPYDRVQEVDEATRDGLVFMVGQAIKRKKPAFLFINNRLEGFSPGTIKVLADRLRG